jgi:hypothetical protein
VFFMFILVPRHKSRESVKIGPHPEVTPHHLWMFGFCFVQFREYFLCNFSETQKQ